MIDKEKVILAVISAVLGGGAGVGAHVVATPTAIYAPNPELDRWRGQVDEDIKGLQTSVGDLRVQQGVGNQALVDLKSQIATLSSDVHAALSLPRRR